MEARMWRNEMTGNIYEERERESDCERMSEWVSERERDVDRKKRLR